MKIAYLGLRWNYAKREEGSSFEYDHLEQGLKDCANDGLFEAHYFHTDVPGEVDQLRDRLDEFDGLIHAEFNEEHDVPLDISKRLLLSDRFCMVWSSDASWRFNNWILPRKDKFSHFITTHNQTIDWYKANNMKVIKSQWFITSQYGPRSVKEKYDVVFLGQKYGKRGDIIRALLDNGINIGIAGNYWEGWPNWSGYITDFEKSLDFMSSAKININLSMPFHGGLSQLKGRFVQIPGLKKLQITTPADNLEEYFKPNKEVIVISNTSEMIERIHYFIKNDRECRNIAEAGFNKALQDHTAQKRFKYILAQL